MTTYIYGLFDPRDERVRYVGKSVNPQGRLDAHLSVSLRGGSDGPLALWIRELHKLNLRPELVLLEDAGEEWEAAEEQWILRLRALGFTLLNIHSGGQRHGVRPPKPKPAPPRWWDPEVGFYTSEDIGSLAGMNEAVRQAVKAAMKERGLTQERVAEEIGLHRVQVNRLLNGKSNDVPESWKRILDLVGIDLAPVRKEGEG